MDTRKEYNKKYYAINKNKILQQMSEQMTCQHCQKIVSKQHLHRHQLTKFCKLSCLHNESKTTNEMEELKNKMIELETKINSMTD